MGIQGLLPFLKKIHQPVNVAQFSGCTVAIDAYCWLHKGAFSCAEKLALGEKTDQYVNYCMKFVNYLLSNNVKPVLVFDGCHLPSKKNVEKSRREKRELNKKKAAQFLREGKRAEARECLQRCIDISPEMALELMNTCRDRGVDCIVAPYEADAQLAYLSKIGIAQLIITEDSDLLLFGCDKVLFKMDHAGNGILIEKQRLNEVTEIHDSFYTFDKFRYMCILSGCDYLPSLTGIGLIKANKVFKLARQTDIVELLKKLSSYLKSNIVVTQEYIDGFLAADNTFLYQLVFDPIERKLVPLNPYLTGINPDDLEYAGSYMPNKKALQIAFGNLNIYTGEQFADFDPDRFVPKYAKKKQELLYMRSIWDRKYHVKPKTGLKEAQFPERPNLKGKELSVKANLKRHSPQKRKREAEDSEASSTELLDMYTQSELTVERIPTECISSDLQRFMFASNNTLEAGQTESEAEEKMSSAETISPHFFKSLIGAHPDLQDKCAPESENDKNKENFVKSPTRNIFASKSPAKKCRFELNAPLQPQIRSRFFASSGQSKAVPKDNTCSTASDEQSDSIAGYKSVHSNTSNTDNGYTPSENSSFSCENSYLNRSSSKPFSFTKTQSSKSNRSSPLSQSAFNWSSFKFAKHKNFDDDSPTVSKTENVAFRKSFCDVSNDFIATSSQDSDMESSKMSKTDSYPCSIDSTCITDGDLSQLSQGMTSVHSDDGLLLDVYQETEHLRQHIKRSTSLNIYTKPYCASSEKDSNENEAEMEIFAAEKEISAKIKKEVVFVIDSDDDSTTSTQSIKYLSEQERSGEKICHGNVGKGPMKMGCRVSGLSKRSKKPMTKNPNDKQQSLRDMFAKFAHTNKP